MELGRGLLSPRRSAVAVLAAGFLLWAGGTERARAFTSTDNLGVAASINASCTAAVSTQVTFGNYDLTDPSALTVAATVTVTCTLGSIVYIMAGQGLYPAAGSTDDTPLRQMSDGGSNRLRYDIFRDPAHTQIWGNTHASGVTLSGTAGDQSVTIYATIPPLQGVMSGDYQDTVIVTVEY